MLLVEAEDHLDYKVIDFKASKGVYQKLVRLGLLPGDQLKVIRRAPLGGPLLVEVNGRLIAIGRSVAEKIHVEKV